MRTESTDRAISMLLALACATCTLVYGLDAGAETPVDEAEKALESAEFDRLIPILETTVADSDQVSAKTQLLYALGLAYRARTKSEDESLDDELDHRADEYVERALKADPELEVDPLVYPPRFVTRVQQIRSRLGENAPETGPGEIFYFERHVERRSRLPLYLPGGVGQFYNDTPFRGATFGLVQLLGLATNIAGYWRVESMRADSGYISADDLSRARGWRRAQYAGLATFIAGWVVGAVEAHLNFDPETVRIRHLDEPPAELKPLSGSSSASGLGVEWTVRF